MTRAKSHQCLICEARVGQLLPFCEWCGTKHSWSTSGHLALSGGICLACGFQSDFPFARCPRCTNARRVLCPSCGLPVAVHKDCDRCGLRYRFFDRLRWIHHRSRSRRRLAPRTPLPLRALCFGVATAAIAVSLFSTPADGWSSSELLLCLGLSAGTALVLMPIWQARDRRTKIPDHVAVLETYDAAEASQARRMLNSRGIDAAIIAERGPAGSTIPPAGIRRVMVPPELAPRAHRYLHEHGFAVRSIHPDRGRRLRVLPGGASPKRSRDNA